MLSKLADVAAKAFQKISAQIASYKALDYNDAKVRLPEEFKTAAIEAIALDQMSLKSADHITGYYEEREARKKELAQRIARLTKTFNRTSFIDVVDKVPDLNNGGQLLHIIVDIGKVNPRGTDIGLSEREKDVAFNAIREKARWMGYNTQTAPESSPLKMVIAFPAYNR